MVFATIGFMLKSGLALGSASFLWVMAGFFNYDTKLPDAPQAIEGFHFTFSIGVGIMFAVCSLLTLAYSLDKNKSIAMADELQARRVVRSN